MTPPPLYKLYKKTDVLVQVGVPYLTKLNGFCHFLCFFIGQQKLSVVNTLTDTNWSEFFSWSRIQLGHPRKYEFTEMSFS